MRLLCMLLLMFLVLLSAACTREIDPAMEAPPVLAEPLPLTVGVYYGDDLRSHEVTNQPPVEVDFAIQTGRAHVSFFDGLFSDLFVKTVAVNSKSRLPQDGDELDAVIEPTIASVDYNFVDDGGFDMKVPVEIHYAIILYEPGGEQIHKWIVDGEAKSEGGVGFLALQDGIEIAMRDAAARFVVEVYKDGATQRCLENLVTKARAAGQLQTCFEGP